MLNCSCRIKWQGRPGTPHKKHWKGIGKSFDRPVEIAPRQWPIMLIPTSRIPFASSIVSLVSTTFRKRRPFSSHVAFRILQHVSQFCHAKTKEAIVHFKRCSFLWIFTFLKFCYYCFAFCLVSRLDSSWIRPHGSSSPDSLSSLSPFSWFFFSLSVHRHKPIVICMARVNISQHTPFNTFSIFFMFIYKLSTPPLGRL